MPEENRGAKPPREQGRAGKFGPGIRGIPDRDGETGGVSRALSRDTSPCEGFRTENLEKRERERETIQRGRYPQLFWLKNEDLGPGTHHEEKRLQGGSGSHGICGSCGPDRAPTAHAAHVLAVVACTERFAYETGWIRRSLESAGRPGHKVPLPIADLLKDRFLVLRRNGMERELRLDVHCTGLKTLNGKNDGSAVAAVRFEIHLGRDVCSQIRSGSRVSGSTGGDVKPEGRGPIGVDLKQEPTMLPQPSGQECGTP